MKLTYTLTLADFKAAWRLHRRQRITRQIMYYVWPILLVAFIIGAILSSSNAHSAVFGQCIALGAGSLVMTVGMPAARFFAVRRNFNRLFPSKQENRTSTIDIDDERIVRELAEASELKVRWTGIYAFAEDLRVSLFYTNKDCFLIIPARAMSAEQREELDALVVRHLMKENR